MVRRPGSTGCYAPESGPIMLRVSFVAHDPFVAHAPKRTLVGPCGRLVNFHDRLACLDLLADSVTHDSNFVF